MKTPSYDHWTLESHLLTLTRTRSWRRDVRTRLTVSTSDTSGSHKRSKKTRAENRCRKTSIIERVLALMILIGTSNRVCLVYVFT